MSTCKSRTAACVVVGVPDSSMCCGWCAGQQHVLWLVCRTVACVAVNVPDSSMCCGCDVGQVQTISEESTLDAIEAYIKAHDGEMKVAGYQRKDEL